MRFRVDQPLAVSRSTAEGALVDPRFYAALSAMDNIAAPQIIRRDELGEGVHIAVRYRFTGNLAAPARAVLDPGKLSWVIESMMHRGEHRADFTMVPDHYGDRIDCWGQYRFEERGAGAAQVVEGDIVVHVPVVGRAVERAILMGMRQHLRDEAAIMADWAASEK